MSESGNSQTSVSLLLVLGMHRSGTSALTGVLNRLGFSAGQQLMPANEFNARGYYEDVELNQRFDAFLHDMGRRWDDERAWPDNGLTNPVSAHAVADWTDWLRNACDFSSPTVIKNPRVCRLLPLLQPALQAAGAVVLGYVFSLRSPYAVMRSLARRDGLPMQRVALLYVAHLLEAEWHTRNQPRVFVEYDDLLSDWRNTVVRMSAGLGLDLFGSGVGEAPASAEIDAFLTAELNHFDADGPAPTGVAVELALEVYSLLKQPVDAEVLMALDDARERWLACLAALEPWLSEAAESRQACGQLISGVFKPNPVMADEASRRARSSIEWSTPGRDDVSGQTVGASWAFGGRLDQRFMFPPLEAPLNALRWKITDRSAFCLIDRIWLEDEQGREQWEWLPGSGAFGDVSDEMLVLGLNESGQMELVVSGSRSVVGLDIPDWILGSIRCGWTFCVAWEALLPMWVLSTWVRRHRDVQCRLQVAEAELAAVLCEQNSLHDRLHQATVRRAHLECQLQQTHENVIRTEAQLALVKELWLGEGPLEML